MGGVNLISNINKEKIEKIFRSYKEFQNINISFFSTIGGMTNSNYLVETESNKYILKLFGKGTDSFIDRNIEKDNLKIVQQLNLDVPNYVFDIKNGVKINKFIDNAETFDSNLVKSNKKEISEILRNVHTSNKIFSNEFNVFKEIEKYESLLENEVEYIYYNKIREEIFKLQDILEDIGIDYSEWSIIPPYIPAPFTAVITVKIGEDYPTSSSQLSKIDLSSQGSRK